MTPEQWRAAWILCETAGDLDSEAQREYVGGATVDAEVEERVMAVLGQLEQEPSYPAAPDRRVGDTVGRYTLTERIGQGGMGEVYAAEDAELRRMVALKFLPSAVAPDKAAASQVISEARLASRLNHPNIVTVFELIETPWGLAMVMELVEGQSLRALLKARRCSRQDILRIGRQVAGAMAAAHAKGIVHRDIKPENIMVRADGYVKVLDFGLAQNLREQALHDAWQDGSRQLPVGTVRYMSPEQKLGRTVAGASDVYSLALVLEELGRWRHPLLAQMKSETPEKRPGAEQVAGQLERLERSSHWPALASGLALLSVLAGLAVYRFRPESAPAEKFRFEPVTSYQTDHDATVAGLSPDGEQLAYATVDGGLIVRNMRTSSVKELNGPPDLVVSGLLFQSEVRLLAVGSVRGVFQTWAIPLDGGVPSRRLADSQLLALSRDRQRICWLNENHEIWTGAVEGTGARLVYRGKADERIGPLFWPANGKAVWFHRLRHCLPGLSVRDVSVNPDTCAESDLVATTLATDAVAVKLAQVRLNSGFFADDGEFYFLRENVDRISHLGVNVWSFRTDESTGEIAGRPRQLSHLNGVVLSQLTGSRDGGRLAAVRTDSTTQTYIANWQAWPQPMLQNRRRLTLERTNSYPHAWTPDSQSVIFESDRNGHSELFRQQLTRREAELLVSTPGDVYMPQLTPDGRWLLMMYQDLAGAGKLYRLSGHSLLRAPVTGGAAVEVPLGQALDEFRCSLPGHGTGCVLRTTQPGEQRYFELDPMAGPKRELARCTFVSTGLGRWSLSPDGHDVVIPDTHSAGRFLDIHLDPNPARRTQVWRQIPGIGRLNSIAFVPSGDGWLANSPMVDSAVNLALLPSFGDLFRAEGFFFIDAQLHPHLIYKSSTNIFGLVSPNGKLMAMLGADVNSNVWSFQRVGR